MSYLTEIERDVVDALADLIERRASRGNAQSKHSDAAAIQFEICRLTDALDNLMEKDTP